MAAKKREGRPSGTALRWNLQMASREFGVNRETLERRKRAASIEPGADGCYSTAEIAGLVFENDQARAYLALTVAKGERERVATEILRKERIPIEDMTELLDATFANIGGIIKAHRDKVLTEQVIEDIFTELRDAQIA